MISTSNNFGRNTSSASNDGLDKSDDDFYYNSLGKVPLWYYIVTCGVLTSLGINGVVFNSLVLRGFYLNENIRTPYNFIILNLMISELILSGVGITFDVLALVTSGWKFGKYTCMTTGAMVTTSGFVSILTLCALSVCRYKSNFHLGNSFQEGVSDAGSIQVIVAVWIYALMLSIPPLLGWGRYAPEISGLGCAPDWHSEYSDRFYVLWILIFGFFIPTTIIIISSMLTCVEAQVFISGESVPNDMKDMYYRKYTGNLIIVLSMNMTYLVCWSPYAVFCIIHTFIDSDFIGPMLRILPTIFAKMSVCINPILYIWLNPQFQGPFSKKVFQSRQRMRRKPRPDIGFKLQDYKRKERNRKNLEGNLQPLHDLLEESFPRNTIEV